jgi:spore germination protein KC
MEFPRPSGGGRFSRAGCIAVLLCAVLLSGCWDYQGMDKINIIAGIAVDKSSDDDYELTIELIDIAAIKSGDTEDSLIVSAVGPTLFEASRNAKKKLYNSLYFGAMRSIIVSEEVAREKGVLAAIDGFIRGAETRETVVLVVSQEETAKEIILADGLDFSDTAMEIAKIVVENKKSDSTTLNVPLFEAYNYVHAKGLELVLPAFHVVDNDGQKVVEVNGLAIFKGDKLVDFLSPEESHYFLMATEVGTRGALSFTMPDMDAEVALEIVECVNNTDVRYADGAVTASVEVKLHYRIVDLVGIPEPVPADVLRNINQQAERVLADRIAAVFRKTQNDPGLDIYGFGNYLYENQYKLWTDIEEDWDELYRNASFEVRVKTTNANVGVTL